LPQSAGVYFSTQTYAAWKDIPSTYIIGDKDQSHFSPTLVDMMIKGAREIEPSAFDVVEHCKEGGHCLMISYPEWTADALRRAAEEIF
jgi:pimeloyl-ACP methyl ester carboxylesterase